MSEEQPQTVNLNEPGHVSDVDSEGQRQSTPASGDDVADLTLNERLTQATQRRDQLLKRRQLDDINEEINALQRGEPPDKRNQDDTESNTSNVRRDSSNARAGSKRYSNVELTHITKRRSVKPKNLDDYHGKSRREHHNWIRDAEVAFMNAPAYFLNDHDKIVWYMQFLAGDPKEQWHNEREKNSIKAESWNHFVSFLLNKI